MDALSLLLFAIFALFVAGTVKGAVGLGLPTTSLGLLTIAVDARTSIAVVLIPMLVSNIWQFYRAGEMMRAIRSYAPFLVMLVIGVTFTFRLSQNAPDRVLLGVLGVIILAYVAASLARNIPPIPDRYDRPLQVMGGSVAGVMGGLAGVWAPPMALYLAARQATKEEFIRASGLMLLVGSVPLLVGYLRAGFLVSELIWVSIGLLIPTFAGFSLGERLRGRLSETGFRRLLMVVFAVLGVNLLRRAVF